MIDRLALLHLMRSAADAAAALILSIRQQGAPARLKADGSPVTDADHAAEYLIVTRFGYQFPQLPIVSEENTASHRLAPTSAFLLIDPIDGTKEFVAGRDEFTVNIALVEQGLPTLGVIVAPATGDAYWVDASGFAWQRRAGTERRLDGSTPAGSRPTVADAPLVAAVSRSHLDARTSAYLASVPIGDTIVCGSSLKFCLVAAGLADVYPRFGPTHEWDTAAGQAILMAAQGDVMTPDGQPLSYGKPGFRNGPYIARSRVAIDAMARRR